MSKVVLITGASSGLGRATAQHLYALGYKVYGTSRDPKRYKESFDFPLLPLEITDQKSIQHCVNLILEKEKFIDVLINNAGVGITGPMEEIDLDEVRKNFSTNCFGPLLMAQAVLPQMRVQKRGLIINITSIAGAMGLPFRGVYSASKSALSIFSESLRMEVKSFGIEVCTLAPGDYATDIASRRYHAPIVENSPYKKAYQSSLASMNSHVDNGNSPLEIALEIEKIITNSKVNVHYFQGPIMQKLSVILKRILPANQFERLIMNHYKL